MKRVKEEKTTAVTDFFTTIIVLNSRLKMTKDKYEALEILSVPNFRCINKVLPSCVAFYWEQMPHSLFSLSSFNVSDLRESESFFQIK